MLVFILGIRHKLLRGKSSEFGLGLCDVSSLGFTGASVSQPQGKSRGPVFPHLNHKVREGMVTKIQGILHFTSSLNCVLVKLVAQLEPLTIP